MGNQQQVCVQIEDGRSYPVMLYDGRLDVDALKEQLADEGLLSTRLNGTLPNCDRSVSRAAFTGDIRGQTKLKKGKVACFGNLREACFSSTVAAVFSQHAGLKSAKAYPSAKGHWWISSLMH
ncbi:hypothetical protein WJX77_008950 [Trebouxia sp. C0004]